jgi:predicted ribosome quality control (RQC) complex YloA/Tae2 family protein
MTNLEYSEIAKEISEAEGSHFSKIYRIDGGYLLKIGKYSIACIPGIRMNLTRYAEESLGTDTLCQRMRAELDNSKLLSVYQFGLDRIIVMEFSGGKIYFEMFGKGNIIFVRDGIIIEAARHESWSSRVIRPKQQYIPPESKTAERLDEVISDKYIIVSMLRLPLGKPYALEILNRAGIGEKTPGTELSDEQVITLKKEITELLAELKPVCFFSDGAPIDFGLVRFGAYAGSKVEEYEKLSTASDVYYHNQKPPENPKVIRLKDRLEKQKERLSCLLEEEKIAKEKGDLIYEKFQEIEAILNKANSSNLDELEAIFANYGAKVDKKNKKIEIEI